MKESVSTRTKVKVIRAIESGSWMQSVAETMGLSLATVKEIRKRANADIKAVSAFLQDATSEQKRRMAHAVRSSGGNELVWSIPADPPPLDSGGRDGDVGRILSERPAKGHITMRKKQDRIADRQELEARNKELEDANLLLRAECAYLKKRRSRASDGVGGGCKMWASEVIAVRDLSTEYGLKGALRHSDQGELYKARSYIRFIERNGMERSMSNKGNCYDNSVIECFFGNLKTEIGELEQYGSVQALVDRIEQYVEYYNERRIQLRLDGMSPSEYRMPR